MHSDFAIPAGQAGPCHYPQFFLFAIGLAPMGLRLESYNHCPKSCATTGLVPNVTRLSRIRHDRACPGRAQTGPLQNVPNVPLFPPLPPLRGGNGGRGDIRGRFFVADQSALRWGEPSGGGEALHVIKSPLTL